MSVQSVIRPNQILVQDLLKKYHNRPVLNHLSITIEAGALCILVGDNGVGKTTLLRILAGLIRPDGGHIYFGQFPAGTETFLRRLIGYVGHQPMLYQDLTAAENLRHYARLYQISKKEKRVDDAIRSIGLEKSQYQIVRTFSRGMQQRLSIARALLHDPEILLFDEPYTGLDNDAACFLDQRLVELHRSGKTIFLAAHQPHRILSLASHLAWLKEGIIFEHIPVQNLKGHPGLAAYLQEAS
jgi:heme exporter protein A